MRRKRQFVLADLIKVQTEIRENPLNNESDEARQQRLYAQEARLRRELKGAPETEAHSH